jgi:D-alanyl-D-alanine dipeptidase
MTAGITARPNDLVYLRDVDPSIVQDMRYAQWHNFVGRKIRGYDAAQCFLTLRAARALQAVQLKMQRSGHALIVYDCYRPQRAVRHFVEWAQNRQSCGKPFISQQARKNRRFLVAAVHKGGFRSYFRECWHFALSNEPYPDTCFDFPITSPPQHGE